MLAVAVSVLVLLLLTVLAVQMPGHYFRSHVLALPSSHPSDDAARAAATTPWPPTGLARAAHGTPDENAGERAN